MTDEDLPELARHLDQRCRDRMAVGSMNSVAALALALGATDEEVDAVWFTIKTEVAPIVPSDSIKVVRDALRQVRKERAWLG